MYGFSGHLVPAFSNFGSRISLRSEGVFSWIGVFSFGVCLPAGTMVCTQSSAFRIYRFALNAEWALHWAACIT